MRWVRAALFFLAKTSEDAVDDVMVLNTGDDRNRSIAMTANLDIDIERPNRCGRMCCLPPGDYILSYWGLSAASKTTGG